MMISRFEMRQAIEAFDLETYLRERGDQRVQTGERAVRCPFCGKTNLIVNVAKKVWHCWSCEQTRPEARGGLLDLIQVLDGMSREQAKGHVLHGFRGQVGLSRVDSLAQGCRSLDEEVVEIDLPAYCQRPIDPTGILPYCRRRGITEWDVERFRLVWCTRGRYADRLIFPVYAGGLLVYWQARAMWDEGERPGRYVKSLNPPKTEGAAGSGDVLFNLDQARQYPSVVITEGPIDAIHVGPDAVCTFGKHLTPRQIGALLQAGVRHIELMWDGPSSKEPHGAWPDMFTVATRYKGLFDSMRLVFLPYGDPGDHGREQLSWFRQHSSRLFDAAPRALTEV